MGQCAEGDEGGDVGGWGERGAGAEGGNHEKEVRMLGQVVGGAEKAPRRVAGWF